MSSTMGKMSIQLNWRFPRKARGRVQNARQDSLAEPGAVSFLQPQLDLRHDLVHFGVRQGALRASESQGKRDALVTLCDLCAAVLVKRANFLEKVARRLLDHAKDRRRGDGVLDADY